jgi:SecD/SecF fusion protein
MVGIASGAYSSIFIASPVLTHWKEREPGYRARRARIVREQGAVPAYALTAAGTVEDVEPERKRRRTRRGSVIAPEQAGQQISREEFQELVADLDIEREPTTGRAGAAPTERKAAPGATAAPPQAAESEPDGELAAERDPSADLTPEDLVLKDEPKRRQKPRRPRNRRHGRSR